MGTKICFIMVVYKGTKLVNFKGISSFYIF
jgi:hypothetical protein